MWDTLVKILCINIPDGEIKPLLLIRKDPHNNYTMHISLKYIYYFGYTNAILAPARRLAH